MSTKNQTVDKEALNNAPETLGEIAETPVAETPVVDEPVKEEIAEPATETVTETPEIPAETATEKPAEEISETISPSQETQITEETNVSTEEITDHASSDNNIQKEFGRDEEDFVLLYQRDYGDEKEAQYGKEIAGAGCILRLISDFSGRKLESLVFVPGVSIIDLYEDHENPSRLTGRTLAKK